MTSRLWLALLVGLLVVGAGAAYAAQDQFRVKASEFAPFGTQLVAADWMDGIGCPTQAVTAGSAGPGATYTDPACTTGDPADQTDRRPNPADDRVVHGRYRLQSGNRTQNGRIAVPSSGSTDVFEQIIAFDGPVNFAMVNGKM